MDTDPVDGSLVAVLDNDSGSKKAVKEVELV